MISGFVFARFPYHSDIQQLQGKQRILFLIKQVCNDEKEPREEGSANEASSSARTVEVTPDFECNVAPVRGEELHMGTEADFSDSGFGYDFESQSKSSDKKAIPNVGISYLRPVG